MSIVYLGKATPASGSGGGSGDAVWGAITGTLSDQTDLQDALNAKQNTLTAGSNITISNGTISATDTTYSAFGGATSSVAGSAGLVPAPTTGDVDKYLKGDGTWGAVSGGSGIQNTATGTDSLTILGTPTTNDKAINIGTHSSADGDGAIALGDGHASYSGSIAIGYDPDQGIFADGQDAIAIGTEAHANNLKSIAIGAYAHANYDYSIALGDNAETSDMEFAIGFGYDQNTSTYRNYVLLDGVTGKIPNDRIDGATGSFTSQDGKTVTVTNGVITSIV